MTVHETSDHYHRPGGVMTSHPIINTIANVVTAVCAVLLAIKVL